MATKVRKAATGRGAKKATKKVAAKKATAKKATAKKATAKKATAKKMLAKKAAARKTTASRKSAAKKTPRKSPARKAITPERALANTRRLLEAKQAHDREAPPWQALDGKHGASARAGFQDALARDQANDLHAAESSMDAIHGASGMQDRHNQGKRDQR